MGCGCDKQEIYKTSPRSLEKKSEIDIDIENYEPEIILIRPDGYGIPGYRIIIDDDGLETFEPIDNN